MVIAEEVGITNSAIHDEKYVYPGLKVLKFGPCQRVRLKSIAVRSQLLPLNWHIDRDVVRANHSRRRDNVRFRIMELYLVAILNWLNCKVASHDSGWGFPVVHEVYFAPDWGERLQRERSESDLYPRALIFPHRIKLRSHDNELVDGGSRQYKSERSDAPVSKCFVLFGPLFESLPPRWLLACAGLTCSLFGGVLFVVSYFLVFHENCFLGGFFLFLSGSLAFALVFAFAHWAYGRISVTQKYLTTRNYCTTVSDMANVLNKDKQIAVLGALAEGSSIRSIERITGIHRDTIMRLGVRAGRGCEMLLDSKMQDLGCRYLQFDEVWGFIGKKERHVSVDDDPTYGDVWTYCAIDSETKLVPSFKCGKRTLATTTEFVHDVASRMRNRVQISTDALRGYAEAVELSFGADVDYGQIVKVYVHDDAQHPERKYSAPHFASAIRRPITGEPEMELVSTSHIERLNATTRLHVKRLSRLTLAFSKKLENFQAAVALHFAYYNFVRRHNTLRCTPAMAAGVERDFWSVGDLVEAVL